MSGQRITADPITMKPDETLRINVDFTLYGLDPSELLTGTPVVVEVGTAELVIANKIVNTATFINRRRKVVAVGKGVQFTVSASGAEDGDNLEVSVGCATNGTPAQFLEVTCPIEVRIRD